MGNLSSTTVLISFKKNPINYLRFIFYTPSKFNDSCLNHTFESPQMEITGIDILPCLKYGEGELKTRIITEFHDTEYSKEFKNTIKKFKDKLICFLNENSYNMFGEKFNEDKHLVFDLNKILDLNELDFLNHFIEDNSFKSSISIYYEDDRLKIPFIINNVDDLTEILIKPEKIIIEKIIREQKNIIEKKDKCLIRQDLINGKPFVSIKTDFNNPNCRFIFRIKNELEIDWKANKVTKVIIYFEITQILLS